MKAISIERIFARMLWNYPHLGLNLTRVANAARGFLYGRAVYARIEITVRKRTEEVSRKAFTDLGRAWKPILTGYFVENSLQRAEFVGLVGALDGVTIHSRPLSYWGGSGIAFNDGARSKCRPYHHHTRLSAKVESALAGPSTTAKGNVND